MKLKFKVMHSIIHNLNYDYFCFSYSNKKKGIETNIMIMSFLDKGYHSIITFEM